LMQQEQARLQERLQLIEQAGQGKQ
jgi:hypothetical protein